MAFYVRDEVTYKWICYATERTRRILNRHPAGQVRLQRILLVVSGGGGGGGDINAHEAPDARGPWVKWVMCSGVVVMRSAASEGRSQPCTAYSARLIERLLRFISSRLGKGRLRCLL